MIISDDESLDLARETKEYENAFLTQEKSGFRSNSCRSISPVACLRHVQKVYDDQLRRYNRGEKIIVMVYYEGVLEQHIIKNRQALP